MSANYMLLEYIFGHDDLKDKQFLWDKNKYLVIHFYLTALSITDIKVQNFSGSQFNNNILTYDYHIISFQDVILDMLN
jgi:hypothetical protein